MAGAGGIVFDVAAKADDEVIDGAGVGVFVDAPDLLEDFLAGDDLGGAIGEVAEEVGLHKGELGGAVGGEEFEGVEADGTAGEGEFVGGLGWWRRCSGIGGGLPGHAAEEALETDEKDVEVEGLGEVVVGAGLDAFEDLFRAGAGGEHEDGDEALGVAEGASDGEAVGAGEHAVEQDGGGGVWPGGGDGEEVSEGEIAVGEVLGTVALGLKVEEQPLGEVGFVFNEGDEGGMVEVSGGTRR